MPSCNTIYWNFKQPGDILFKPSWSTPWHIVIKEDADSAREKIGRVAQPGIRFSVMCGKNYAYNSFSELSLTPTKKRKVCECCILEGSISERPIAKEQWDDDLPF